MYRECSNHPHNYYFELLTETNIYVDKQAPWELKKSNVLIMSLSILYAAPPSPSALPLPKKSEGTKNTILLSPAAASFDQFSNFENRGMYFKNLIKKRFERTHV